MSNRELRFPLENALLRAASRIDDAGPIADPSSSLDWEYIVRAARRQGVAALLYEWLKRHPEIVIDPPVVEALHSLYWMGYFHNRLLLSELDRLSDAVARAAVPVMPLKGAQLAIAFYPAPVLRPLSDLDLLVRLQDVEALDGILSDLSYHEIDPEPSYIGPAQLSAESTERCWTSTRAGTAVLIEFRTNPLELAVGRLLDLDPSFTRRLRDYTANVWGRSTSDDRDSASAIRSMTPEDLLLHVTTHYAAKHADFRLIWMHDCARILLATPAFDWDYVWRMAAQLRVRAAVCVALEAAVRWVNAPVDAASLERCRESVLGPSGTSLERWEYRQLSGYAASLADRDLTIEGPGVWPLGAALARVSDWSSRTRILRWVAFPTLDYLSNRHHLPPQSVSYMQAYALRFRRRR